ncbi:aminomethyl-transferring glycine dehydrogenase subunit GcvPB [Candidatus Bathyarchaeota archaeon]|nr:aminomethyl-transferring glycine dehydrogenase subunit GcvPB [Candidatus Bathyarchaeota archaeon]MBT7913329.1 aminomethyl-transferring glycine dehydrogenase subunit GcvPB [Candidatus Bathyarchaeota archaeon]
MRIREYHAPRWNESIIHELTSPGERGFIPPRAEEKIKEKVGSASDLIPSSMRRSKAPDLPELSQAQVLRHYLRLSQMTLGMEMEIDLGIGTCTMKYSPKINEELAGLIGDIHPLQPEETIQGLLEMVYEFGDTYLKEISGMDAFSFQPPGGSAGCYNNALMMRKYHADRGEPERDEIITTIFSHPCDAAVPATAGYKVLTLYPDEMTGLPDTDALKEVVGPRTAGCFITNPEDIGIFNLNIDEWTGIIHDVGGLCSYDQANANAIMGVTRAKEAGFDMLFFNLHKTFGSPHGSSGPGSAAVGVTKELEEYLPSPVIVKMEDGRYSVDYDRPKSIGKVRDFMGNLQVVVRSYAWCMAMGAEGLREAAEVSMINNQYLVKKLKKIKGITLTYPGRRVDQARWSLEQLKKDTGIGIAEVNRRVIDYGIQSFFTSHHPWLIPEPFTPEPCETYSKADIDYWCAVVEKVIEEAYTDPELVRTAPHNSSNHRIAFDGFNDPKKWAMSWRAYRRKQVE